MSWWSRARQEKAQQWFAGAVTPGGVVPPQGASLIADTCYVNVFLESLYISAVRKGLTRFYGTVTSTCTMPSARGGPAESVVVTTPKGLENADAEHLDRVVVDRTRLFGPVPYAGGDLVIEVGLFSTPSADLLAPFLSVIEDIAGLASAPFVQVARPFVAPVKRGLGLLLGDTEGRSELEIGLSKLYAPPNTGWMAVARVPAASGVLTYDPSRRMLALDGAPIDQPHLALSIDAATQREDWASIPSLLESYNDVKREAEAGRLNAAQEALASFRRRATFCPDLISSDAKAIITKVEAKVNEAFPATVTGVRQVHRFPEFEEINLYAVDQ